MIRPNMQARAVRRGYGAQQGFTLIELMIVVAIISVLTVIAFGSYNWATTKTRRKEAESCLAQSAQYMERFYATNLRYDKDLAGTNIVFPNLCPADLNTYYAAPSLASTTTTYTISIAPAGTQASRDTACKTLAVDQAGKKYNNTTTVDTGTCW